MKDTTFSLEVKKALINFGGTKILNWNLFDVRIEDNSFDFGVAKNGLATHFSILKGMENKFIISYCVEKEAINESESEFINLLHKRAKTISANEIAEYIDSKLFISSGHRAPNCMAVPNCGA